MIILKIVITCMMSLLFYAIMAIIIPCFFLCQEWKLKAVLFIMIIILVCAFSELIIETWIVQ